MGCWQAAALLLLRLGRFEQGQCRDASMSHVTHARGVP